MLRIDDLCVAYGPVQVLRGLSIEVPRGEVVTLLGGNGSGKSTTLKAIMGAVASQGGSIRFEDRELRGLRPEAIVPLGITLVVAAIAAIGVFGLVDEWSQSFSPGRRPDLADALADVVGATAGFLLAMRYTRRR